MERSFRDMRFVCFSVLIGVMISAFAFSGCGDEDAVGPDTDIITPLEVTKVIVSPKAPEPGETVQLTAVVVSDGINLELPTYSWTANKGTLKETDQVSVRWVAPATSDLCMISLIVTNSVSSSSFSFGIIVGTSIEVVPSQAGELHATITGDSVYFLSSSGDPEEYDFGFQIGLYMDGGGVVPVTTDYPGLDYAFDKKLTLSAHTFETILPNATDNPINIILDDLVSLSQSEITSNNRDTLEARHLQHTKPAFSPDGNLITYEVFRPHPIPGLTDTFDVAIYNRSLGTETIATETHGIVRKNFHSTFSSDGNWLVFISNRTGPLSWDLYGLPVTGGTVPLDSSDVVQITFTGGAFCTDITQSTPGDPLKTWNPNPLFPVMAIKDVNNDIHIVGPNGPSDDVVQLGATPIEMLWSHDGEHLAVSTTTALYLINYTLGVLGGPELLSEVDGGNVIADIGWSGDDAYIVYSVTRSNEIWYELYDVGKATDLTSSVVITPPVSVGSLAKYIPVMHTKPQFEAGRVLHYLNFDNESPRMMRLDLTGALP